MLEAHRWEVVVKTHPLTVVLEPQRQAAVLETYPLAADTAAHSSIHPLALLYLILKQR